MSFPRYADYKDSGIEWLGEVPGHWDIFPLKRDLAFLTSGSRGWAEHYSDDGAAFIRIGNLTRDSIRLDLSDLQRVEVPEGVEGERTRVMAGDVLFSITAYLGSVAIASEGLETAYVSQHVALARLKQCRLLPAWVGYVALSHVGKTYLETQGYGGTKVQLSLDDVANLIMTAPPLPEQTAIAAFLDHETAKIDFLVAEQKKLIDLLAEKRQAVICRAVTKGLNPAAPMKHSGIEWFGEVPEHWELRKIKTMFRLVKRQDNADAPVLSVYRDYGVVEKESRDDNFNKTPDDLSLYQTVGIGDLVINKMKAWQGSLGISPHFGITSPDYVVFEPIHSESARFLHHSLRSAQMPAVYQMISNGIRPQQWRLEPDKFGQLLVPMPPVAEQERIVEFLENTFGGYDALADEARRAIDLLKEHRSALISAAVTGKIDVRGLVKAEAA